MRSSTISGPKTRREGAVVEISTAHVFYIATILFVGMIIGYVIGRQAAESEAKRQKKREERREAFRKKAREEADSGASSDNRDGAPEEGAEALSDASP